MSSIFQSEFLHVMARAGIYIDATNFAGLLRSARFSCLLVQGSLELKSVFL